MAPRVSLLASISLAAFLLALLGAAQLRSQAVPPSNRYARDEVLRRSVQDLEAQRQGLSTRVRDLRGRVQQLENESARRSSAAQAAKTELDRKRVTVGLSALHGPGIAVTVHDGRNPNDPTDRSLGWVVHYQDLQDLVNLLWAQGAEAITVNDQRVVPTTSFFYAGVNILVNTASRLTGPYVVTAIGDPPALVAGMTDPNHLGELKSRSRIYGLDLSWQRLSRASVRAYDATFILKYAQPVN
jgi:uncharacterized protein YlxW (UPF0749 family)